jgi:hypothetical protein
MLSRRLENGVVFDSNIMVNKHRVLFTRIERKIIPPFSWNNAINAIPSANGSRRINLPKMNLHGIEVKADSTRSNPATMMKNQKCVNETETLAATMHRVPSSLTIVGSRWIGLTSRL